MLYHTYSAVFHVIRAPSVEMKRERSALALPPTPYGPVALSTAASTSRAARRGLGGRRPATACSPPDLKSAWFGPDTRGPSKACAPRAGSPPCLGGSAPWGPSLRRTSLAGGGPSVGSLRRCAGASSRGWPLFASRAVFCWVGGLPPCGYPILYTIVTVNSNNRDSAR
jgi:hypothetical protein